MNNLQEETKEFTRLLQIAEDLYDDGVSPDEIAKYIDEQRKCKFVDPFIYSQYCNFISSII